MLTTLKRLRTCRPPLNTGFLPLNKRITPLVSYPKRQIFTEEQPQENALALKHAKQDLELDLDRLTAKRIEDAINPEEIKRIMEETLLEFHKGPEGFKKSQLKKMQKRFGPNLDRIVNTRYQVEVDALKDRKLITDSVFNFQNSLEHYKFADPIDYHVLDRTDEIKALSRLTYVDLENTFIKKKLKYVLEKGEHYSKHQPKDIAENYLQGKPENYMAVFNLPEDITAKELFSVFSKYGKIKNFNLRRAFIGTPAFFEVAYESPDSIAQAKAERNNVKYRGKALYIKTAEDNDYEEPANRTLVISGINPSYSYQTVIEAMVNFGNVMHFEMVVTQPIAKLPSPEEVESYIEQHNISENGKYKVKVKTHKYDIINGELVHSIINDENALEVNDSRPDFYDEKIMNQEIKDLNNQEDVNFNQEAQKYQNKIFGDPNLKVLEAMDISPFKLPQNNQYTKELLNRKDEPNLQYYLKSIDEIKAQASGASSLPFYNKIQLNNLIEEPHSYNKGYCFVTFSHTDEAKKAMLEISSSPIFGNQVNATLKKNTDHMDWDAEYFVESYQKIRAQTAAYTQDVFDKEQEIRHKEATLAKIEKFKSDVWGDKFEENILNHPVKKDQVEIKKTPEQWFEEFQQNEQKAKVEEKKRLDEIFERETLVQFSNKPHFEKDLDSDDEGHYQLGRSYSAKVGDKDLKNFERLLRNKNMKRFDQLTSIPEDPKAKGIEQLLRKYQLTEDGVYTSDAPLLDDVRKEIHDINAEARLEKIAGISSQLEDKADAYRASKAAAATRKKASAVRLQAAVAKGQERAASKGEDQYFNPFKQEKDSKKPSIHIPTSSEDVTEKAEYLKKKQEYINNVTKLVTGDYTNKELEEELEKSQKEYDQHGRLRTHFLETDKDGNKYITAEDEQRFAEEKIPEDPEARIAYENKLERQKQLEELGWLDNIPEAMKESQVLGEYMMTKGFPVDVFKFQPTDDCNDIEAFIEKLRLANPEYTYERSVDEDQQDVIIKFVKFDKAFDYDVGIETQEDFKEFVEGITGYLRENGIPEEELQLTEVSGSIQDIVAASTKNNSGELTETDQKVLELLMKKFPKDVIEKAMSQNPFAHVEEMIEGLDRIQPIKNSIEKERALTKEDFVKYSSMMFNVRGKDGKFKKPKQDVI